LGEGSSGSAAQVSGVAALMLSVQSTLTPAQILSILQSSARPFPAGTSCAQGGTAEGLCGKGLLDARSALNALNASALPPTVTITPPSQVVSPNSTVSLAGTATVSAGRTVNSYSWSQLSGPFTVAISNASSNTNASFTAPATGTYGFQLSATDSGGLTGTANTTVRVNSPPVLTTFTPQPQIVQEGSGLSFQVTATDPDGDTPIFVAVAPLLPSGATLSASGQFNWPAASPAGNYTLTYFARDNDNADSQTGTVNITVQASSSSPPSPPPASAPPASSTSTATSSGSGGGGCTLSRGGSVDMLMPAWFLLSVVLWAWRAKKRRLSVGLDETHYR
jgi:hypothetical protein